jgi:hypothetical protein
MDENHQWLTPLWPLRPWAWAAEAMACAQGGKAHAQCRRRGTCRGLPDSGARTVTTPSARPVWPRSGRTASPIRAGAQPVPGHLPLVVAGSCVHADSIPALRCVPMVGSIQWRHRALQECRVQGFKQPLLEGRLAPAALGNQRVVEAGVTERPHDVGGTLGGEAAGEPAAGLE